MHTCDASMAPRDIETLSFARIDELVAQPRPYAGRLWEIARRCIHTTGDPTLLKDLVLTEKARLAGIKALQASCSLYTDTTMALCGITQARMDALQVQMEALLAMPHLSARAQKDGCTRARAAVLAVCDHLGGSIVVIGNAPTALLTLLEVLDNGAPEPALIVGMPVGFVNAQSSKELLHTSPYAHFTLLGTRGGSAVAACCVNALANQALEGLRNV